MMEAIDFALVIRAIRAVHRRRDGEAAIQFSRREAAEMPILPGVSAQAFLRDFCASRGWLLVAEVPYRCHEQRDTS